MSAYLEDERDSVRGWWFRGTIPVASGERIVGWSLAFDLLVFNRSYMEQVRDMDSLNRS